MIVVGEWLGSVGMILRFVSDLLYLLVVFFFRSCKRIKDVTKERKIISCSKLYFGVHDYFMAVERFPEPEEVVAFLKLGIEIYVSFGEVCLAEATTSKRPGWRQAQDLASTCATLLAAEKKGSFQ